jgi:UDP-N-acetyl-D-mannosaminuronic acid dehydrogenase
LAKILSVGVGHVGLPLSLKLWEVGHDVALVDIDLEKINGLKRGVMPFFEHGCEQILNAAAPSDRFRPLTYQDDDLPAAIGGSEYLILTLGTPLGTDYTFRYDQYFHVLDCVAPYLSQGVTVIVRSTVAPHFTNNVVATRIAAQRGWGPGVDFHVAFCPERLVQGEAIAGIEELPEIIGADHEASAERASVLFRSLGEHKPIFRISTVEAELAKLFLNSFRYTLFGLANEFAIIAEQYDADMFAILGAANSGYPRGGIPKPGPSRGPCLGKDAATLAFSSTASSIIHAAIKTNENIVLHIAHDLRARLGTLSHKRIAVLGMAFKPGTDDTRDNLSSPLLNVLEREGAETVTYDPCVRGLTDATVLHGADAIVLMTPHDDFKKLAEGQLVELTGRRRGELYVFDLWNIWPWADRIFGKGHLGTNEDSGNGRMRFADAGGRAAPH